MGNSTAWISIWDDPLNSSHSIQIAFKSSTNKWSTYFNEDGRPGDVEYSSQIDAITDFLQQVLGIPYRRIGEIRKNIKHLHRVSQEDLETHKLTDFERYLVEQNLS